MMAAIYARKSRPEEGKHEDEKSVTRQKDEARAYCQRKGWIVAEDHVYEDDAISGKYGEDHRPGLKALLAAAEATPRPFDVVVMAKDDRLMRNQWKLAVALSRLYDAGVRLFYYQEDREVNLDDATGRFMEQVRGYASEAYRESVTKHMVDALKRKAKAGHVHGGRVFGYDNVRVEGHVERQIDEAEAAVVRQVFEAFTRGARPKRIAADLTAADAPACRGLVEGDHVDERQRPRSPAPRDLSRRGRLTLGRRRDPRRQARAPDRLGGAVAGRAGAPRRAAPGLPAHHGRPALGPPVQQRRVGVPAHRAPGLRRVRRRADRGLPVARPQASALLPVPEQRARPSPGAAAHERPPRPAGDDGSSGPQPHRRDAPATRGHHGDARRMSASSGPRHHGHAPSGAGA